MCENHDALSQAYLNYRAELIEAGLLIPSGVDGVYGRGGLFEDIIQRFEALVTQAGAPFKPEVMRFPPIVSRQTYLKTDHIENMPDLMGSVHSFCGNEREQRKMVEKAHAGEGEWVEALSATDVMLVPAACYPLYPAATGRLSKEGRLVDLKTFVFRHEPSVDPARMQSFRQREYVRLGNPQQALSHRNEWLERAEKIHRSLGLDVQVVAANDPFFGRAGKMMKASQLEQELKFEIVVPICSEEKPTAITSCNYHLDHFGLAFDITTAEGEPAHTACIGFGLERIALALFKTHGLNPQAWPASVKKELEL